ncbi:PAS domain-containing protein [Anaeromyxobacter paludicola]|nr:PAS domain-containing protein [Anaeromyxobacter paludicola]
MARSLANRVTLAALGLAAALVFGLGAVSYFAVRQLIRLRLAAVGQERPALAGLRWLGLAHALMGLLLLAVVAVAARFAALRVTARLTRLSEGARRIADGTAGALPCDPDYQDEVETVTRAFNGTLAQLRAAQQTLEQRVRERTAALEQRERELRQSQEQLALALEGSRLGSWQWDIPSGQVAYGHLWPRLLGYTGAEIAPTIQAWGALVHPEDAERVRRDVVAHLKGLTSEFDLQYRMRARDGGWRWIHSRGRVVERKGTGIAVRAAGTNADVTWRCEAEERLRDASLANARLAEALQASEERLRLALAAGDHAEWDLDPAQGRITRGPRWWEILGAPPEAHDETLAGWKSVLHPDDRGAACAALQACIDGKAEVYEASYRVRGRDGAWRSIRSRGHAVKRDEAGRALRVTGTSTDVTELDELQGRLLAATRLASVGTLAAGVAHEINNPLTYVSANLAVLLDELSAAAPLEERRGELRERAEEARQGASRIASVVAAMRALGGPERAGQACAIDVGAELQAALQMARNQVVQRAALEVSIAPDLPKASAKTNELGRVFLNLLVNAAQALPEGQADRNRVTVEARRSGDGIVVEVSDTGPGIPPEVRERMFEAFFTTKPVGVGTGLGLSIARSIVVSAGGAIEVDSEPGRGATFRVRLPAAGAPAAASGAAPPPAPASAGARRRVLLIDDEPMVRRSLERILRRHHDVVSLGSAEEALARIVAGERPDVILCDFMMSGLDGIGFHEALSREHAALLERLVFVSGGAFGERATRFLREHAVTVAPKPIDPPALLALIDRIVTRAEAARAA